MPRILALAQKLMVRSGAWFRYGDLQIAQGREKTRQYLKDNPKFAAELREKILALNNGDGMLLSVAAAEGEPEEALAEE